MIADKQWKMRASDEDKKVIADLAKHFHCKQSRLVKTLTRVIHEAINEERKIKHLSPVA